MKFKNLYIAFVATTTLSIGMFSCSDSFLDEKMYSNYGPEVKDYKAKVLGMHRTFAALWGESGEQGFVSCWQLGTDVGVPGAITDAARAFFRYEQMNSDQQDVGILWERLYEMIDRANLVIAEVEADENGNQAELAAYKAEAMFFRAYAYNMLVTMWGNVPLVVESTTVPKTDYVREDVAKIDELIESDLTFAIANLPEIDKLETESRISKDAARQMAGEAYLRMGMRDASYFKKAEDVVTPIINEGKYKLIAERYGKFLSDAGDYYSDMFRWGNQRRSQGNTEGIWTFQMEYERDVTGGTVGSPQQRRNWVPAFHKIEGMQNADSIGGRGNGRLRISNYVKYGLFANGDIRNSNHNIRRQLYYNRSDFEKVIGIDANGWRVEADKGVRNVTVRTGDPVTLAETDSTEVCYPHPTKWGGYDPQDDFGFAIVKDWPVMRLGETYLLRAEARFRQGNNQGAAEDINVLRDRAFKATRASSGNTDQGKVSASDINLGFILDERIRELVSEENRRMTLVRTNTLKERIALNGETAPTYTITGFQDYHTLLPIPLNDINLNKDAVLEQNPGY